MKYLLLFLIAGFFLNSCVKDKNDPVIPDPAPTYYTYDGNIGSNDNSTIITDDQNLLISGTNLGKVCLLKISKPGLLIWRKEFETNSDPLTSVVQSADQSIFLCGNTYRNAFFSGSDVLLVKTNVHGDTIWTKTYGGTGADFGYYIRNSVDGNLLIGGTSFSHSIDHSSDIYLVKVNPDGDTLWTRTYVDPGVEIPHHLLQMEDGEILITGYESNTSKGVYLLKLNAQGIPLWNKKISSPVSQQGLATLELPNGDLVTCGKSTRDTYDKILVVKFDSVGNVVWEREYGDEYYSEQGNSITLNADGTLIITGSYSEPHSGQTGIIILKLDAQGNQLLLKNFGGGYDDDGDNILKDENDDNIITGNHNGTIFMTRTDTYGVFK